MVTKHSAFTLVEMMMTVVIISFMFVAVNSMLVMTMKRQLVNSFAESEEQKCQRAALEINSYIRKANTVEIINASDTPITTGGANRLRTLDSTNGVTAEFLFTPGSGTNFGNLEIFPQGRTNGFVYAERILPPSTTNVFTWGTAGFIEYSFILGLDTGDIPYTGVARPNL